MNLVVNFGAVCVQLVARYTQAVPSTCSVADGMRLCRRFDNMPRVIKYLVALVSVSFLSHPPISINSLGPACAEQNLHVTGPRPRSTNLLFPLPHHSPNLRLFFPKRGLQCYLIIIRLVAPLAVLGPAPGSVYPACFLRLRPAFHPRSQHRSDLLPLVHRTSQQTRVSCSPHLSG